MQNKVFSFLPLLVLGLSLLSTGAMAVGKYHPRRAWVPDRGKVQRICSDRGGCSWVIRTQPCQRVRCPMGQMCFLKHPVQDLPALPDGSDQLRTELDAMAQDPLLRPLVRELRFFFWPPDIPRRGRGDPKLFHLGSKKDEPAVPPVWAPKKQSPWHWEVGLALAQGAWGDNEEQPDKTWGYMYGASLRLGFRYQGSVFDDKGGYGVEGCINGLLWTFWELVTGNQWGADLHFHTWREGDRTRFGLGLKPVLLTVLEAKGEPRTIHRFRTLSILGMLTPELGLHLSNQDRDPAMYLRFQAPVSFLLTDSLGFELRLSWGLQLYGDRPSWFGGLDIGLLLR